MKTLNSSFMMCFIFILSKITSSASEKLTSTERRKQEIKNRKLPAILHKENTNKSVDLNWVENKGSLEPKPVKTKGDTKGVKTNAADYITNGHKGNENSNLHSKRVSKGKEKAVNNHKLAKKAMKNDPNAKASPMIPKQKTTLVIQFFLHTLKTFPPNPMKKEIQIEVSPIYRKEKDSNADVSALYPNKNEKNPNPPAIYSMNEKQNTDSPQVLPLENEPIYKASPTYPIDKEQNGNVNPKYKDNREQNFITLPILPLQTEENVNVFSKYPLQNEQNAFDSPTYPLYNEQNINAPPTYPINIDPSHNALLGYPHNIEQKDNTFRILPLENNVNDNVPPKYPLDNVQNFNVPPAYSANIEQNYNTFSILPLEYYPNAYAPQKYPMSNKINYNVPPTYPVTFENNNNELQNYPTIDKSNNNDPHVYPMKNELSGSSPPIYPMKLESNDALSPIYSFKNESNANAYPIYEKKNITLHIHLVVHMPDAASKDNSSTVRPAINVRTNVPPMHPNENVPNISALSSYPKKNEPIANLLLVNQMPNTSQRNDGKLELDLNAPPAFGSDPVSLNEAVKSGEVAPIAGSFPALKIASNSNKIPKKDEVVSFVTEYGPEESGNGNVSLNSLLKSNEGKNPFPDAQTINYSQDSVTTPIPVQGIDSDPDRSPYVNTSSHHLHNSAFALDNFTKIKKKKSDA